MSLLCFLDGSDGFEHQHHSPGQSVSPSPSSTLSIPPHTHSQQPSSHVRLLLAKKPCETHRAGAEREHSFICFGLGISHTSCKRAAATSCWGRGPTSPGVVTGHPRGTRLKDWHSWCSRPWSACFTPCAAHAFIQDLGRAREQSQGKPAGVLPWAAGEPEGRKSPVCLRCKQGLLICCLFVFLQSPRVRGERRWSLPFVRGQGQAIGSGGEKIQRGSWNLLWEGKIFFGYL